MNEHSQRSRHCSLSGWNFVVLEKTHISLQLVAPSTEASKLSVQYGFPSSFDKDQTSRYRVSIHTKHSLTVFANILHSLYTPKAGWNRWFIVNQEQLTAKADFTTSSTKLCGNVRHQADFSKQGKQCESSSSRYSQCHRCWRMSTNWCPMISKLIQQGFLSDTTGWTIYTESWSRHFSQTCPCGKEDQTTHVLHQYPFPKATWEDL